MYDTYLAVPSIHDGVSAISSDFDGVKNMWPWNGGGRVLVYAD